MTLETQVSIRPAGQPREPVPYLDSLIARGAAPYQPRLMPTRTAEALTPREHSILELLGHGRSNKEIARSLRISPETVKSHVKHMFTKLGIARRTQAMPRAQSLGLVAPG
jgi:LuxR family maltose regulon positive regulatory protein